MESPRHEDAVLSSITEIVSTLLPRPGEVYIGDDAAVLNDFAGQVIVSTDVCVAGVHLDTTIFSVEDLGFKAVTSALSDIAAMGARSRAIVLGVSAPPGTDLESLHRGAALAATMCDTPIVGGDMTTAPQLSVAVTVLGECPFDDAVTRDGARPGDAIFVSGPLGAAAAGLRLARTGTAMSDDAVMAQRRPMPRLREGQIYRMAGVTSMMDLSDGLGIDLHRLADASNVGFTLDEVPVAPQATWEEALSGGEDYELLCTTSDVDGLMRACAEQGIGMPLRIGTVVADANVRTLEDQVFARRGWQHEL